MSIAFPRSMRALKSDGFRRSTLWLFILLLLLAGWAAWLFLARVPVYEIADGATVEGGTGASSDPVSLVVSFPPAIALERIRPGQPARFHPAGLPRSQYQDIPALVANTDGRIRDGQIKVELVLYPDANFPVPLKHGLTGTVEIEIERVAPVVLLLRAAGHWFDATGVESHP